jgi:ParB-like chromosome segregation protein Spo0J
MTYQLMPPLVEEEYQALKADIAERGVIVPIEVDEEGNILDGHHRLKAWLELKEEGTELPDYPRAVRGGMTETQKRNYVRVLNIVRRHLTKEQLQKQWEAMRQDGMTYQEIADATGNAESTVRTSIASVSQNCETEFPDEITGKDGKKYPAEKRRKKKKEKPKPPEAPPVSIFTGTDKGEEKAKAKAQKIVEAGSEGAKQQVQVTMFSHESEEYYTPPEYIEAAREVLGIIELDPASCEMAQEWVKAETFYTIADDGLRQKWSGRVWLNPPYGKEGNDSNQGLWSQKLITEYEAGNVQEAILLVKAALGYEWFENIWRDWPVCFARKRLSFIKANGTNEGRSKQATAFFYFGKDVDKFKEVFGQFGRVIMPED